MNQEPDNLVARALKMLKGDHRERSDEVLIEPAATNAKPLFWERRDGTIQGPATPQFLARVGTGPATSFWIVLTYHGLACWVPSNLLRSRQAFEENLKAREAGTHER